MVKIALAGGTGGLGFAILDALKDQTEHEFILLSRTVSIVLSNLVSYSTYPGKRRLRSQKRGRNRPNRLLGCFFNHKGSRGSENPHRDLRFVYSSPRAQ